MLLLLIPAPDGEAPIQLGRRSRIADIQQDIVDIKAELKEVKGELNVGNSLLTEMKEQLVSLTDHHINAASEYILYM